MESLSVGCFTSDADHLFWLTRGGQLVRYTKATHTVESLETAGPLVSSCGLSVRDTSIFVVSSSNGTTGTLNQYDATGPGWPNASRNVIVGMMGPSSVAADDTYMYPTELASTHLRRCAIANPGGNNACTGGELTSGLLQPHSIVQDDASLYLISDDTRVVQVQKSDAGTRDLWSTSTFEVQPDSLAIGRGTLYWTSALAVTQLPLDGGSRVDLENDVHGIYASPIAADDRDVFWGDVHGLHAASRQAVIWSTAGTNGVAFIALDANNVFWIDINGTLRRASR